MDQRKEFVRIPCTADDLTRRQWILRLGELVALAGVSGALPDFATALAKGQGIDVTQLPPGLYEASQDHLVHALSSAGKNWSPPSGSETEYVQPNSQQPLQFFTNEEFAIITRLFEIFLGTVDATVVAQSAHWLDLWLFSSAGVRTAAQRLDPMHRALAVAYYGEDSVRELETADPQAIARTGLRALHDLSRELYDRDFGQLVANEQIELVTTSAKTQPQPAVAKFLELARTEAIRAYYTSAKGLEELDYKGNAYYTESPGCEQKKNA